MNAWVRAVAVLVAIALCAAVSTGCAVPAAPGEAWRAVTGTQMRPSTHPPWVETNETVWDLDSAGRDYVALRIGAGGRFELAAVSRRTGATTRRVRTDPFREWSSGDYVRFTVGRHAVAYRRGAVPAEDVLHVLDPRTLRVRWSRAGPVTEVTPCHPHVCVTDLDDHMEVLDGTAGHVLWRSGENEFLVGVDAFFRITPDYRDDAWGFASVDPATGRRHWTFDPSAPFRDRVPDEYVRSGMGFEFVDDHRMLVLPWYQEKERDAIRALGSSLYDRRTGDLVWSRQLDLTWANDLIAGIDPAGDTVHVVDPATGRTRWSVRLPEGHSHAHPPIAVDALGYHWLPTYPDAADAAEFRAIDPATHRLLPRNPTRHTVILGTDGTRTKQKVMVGTQEKTLQTRWQNQPVDSATGHLANMPKVPLPPALRTNAVYVEKPVAVIDKDGHGIMQPFP